MDEGRGQASRVQRGSVAKRLRNRRQDARGLSFPRGAATLGARQGWDLPAARPAAACSPCPAWPRGGPWTAAPGSC